MGVNDNSKRTVVHKGIGMEKKKSSQQWDKPLVFGESWILTRDTEKQRKDWFVNKKRRGHEGRSINR